MKNIHKAEMQIENDLVRNVRKLGLPELIQSDVLEVLAGLKPL